MKQRLIFTSILFFTLSSSLLSQSVSEMRSFSRSLNADRDTRLEVNNRYGDVHLTSWNRDSIYIKAEIEATANSTSKLKNLLEGIEISISESGRSVRAETKFGKELTVLVESFKGFTDKIIDYGSRIRINYFISLPDYVDISIKNQFGDVSVENNAGTISVDLSNGDFKAGSLNRLAELNFDFGDAEIGSVKSARIVTTFSKFLIKESGEVTISSTASRYELGTIGKLNFESRRDKFFIENISGIKGTSYFSDFKINHLTGESDVNLKYGSFEVEKTDNRFDRIDISSSYSDITLEFDPSFSSRFEINHTNAFVVLPEINTRSEKETLNDEKKEYLIKGTTGSDPGSREIRIDATRGNICLKYR
ncbi:MAG: DUF4097 family beta strand repeat protein [Bacteroidales bacterium]|nr:DUF4097 family beta strand repeat protein [Bacteroidales bacterium]